jgi:hypothetical protein
MWQSFALVDQRGTIWGIHDDLTQAVKDCDEMASLAEDEHEDQRNHYTLIAWKWPVPLDPEKERSIYVFPDIWVKASKGFESPITTENPDGLVLASNVNPFDDKYEVYYPWLTWTIESTFDLAQASPLGGAIPLAPLYLCFMTISTLLINECDRERYDDYEEMMEAIVIDEKTQMLERAYESNDLALNSLQNPVSLKVDILQFLLAATKKGLFVMLFLGELTNRVFKYLRPSIVKFLYWATKALVATSEITKDLCKSLNAQHLKETGNRIAVLVTKGGVFRDINGHLVKK